MAGAAAVARGAQGCVTFLERPWVHGPCAIANTYGELRLQKLQFARPGGVEGTSFAPTRRELRGALHSRNKLNSEARFILNHRDHFDIGLQMIASDHNQCLHSDGLPRHGEMCHSEGRCVR